VERGGEIRWASKSAENTNSIVLRRQEREREREKQRKRTV
jgi:hypothetical protein